MTAHLLARIYVLVDPRDEEIRYVGWTIRTLPQRLRSHLRDKYPGHKTRWVQMLRRLGLKPRIDLIQEVPLLDWAAAERYWIGYFRSMGCRLTNSTDGGEGRLGHHPTPSVIEILSRKAKARWADPQIRAMYLRFGFQPGQVVSAAWRQKLSAARKKRLADIDPEEARRIYAKQSATVRGRAKSKGHKDKLSAALKGKPKSEETRAKMSKAHEGLGKGKVMSQESRDKMAASHRGKVIPEEVRAKIRASLVARARNPAPGLSEPPLDTPPASLNS